MHEGIESARAQEQREQRGGRGAVHVVIAEDRDALAALHRIGDALGRGRHRIEHIRIRHQPLDGGIEEAFDLVDLDVSPGKDARQQFRQIVPLRDRKRARGAALVEPVAPGAAADRAFDAEKQAVGKGDVHGRFRAWPDRPETTLADSSDR